MKKVLLLVLLFCFSLLFIRTNNETVKAVEEKELSELVNDYYNNGNYTKKSNIYLNPVVINEMTEAGIKAFHGKVNLERTTYYQKDEAGKDLLFMANLDGSYAELESGKPVDGINSGYRTVTNSDGSTYMDHFIYDGVKAIQTYKTTISSVEDYYVTLYDLNEESYFDEWILEDNLYTYYVSNTLDNKFKDFLAFTAPCLEEVFFSENTENYFEDNMKLTVGFGQNNYGDYLILRMYVSDTGLDDGYVTNLDGILSEARIYKGNEVFDEEVVEVPITIKDILAGKYPTGTPVEFKGVIVGIKSEWSTQFNNMEAYIGDSEGNKILLYRTNTQVKLGDVVIASGTVNLYLEKEYQLAQGSVCTPTTLTDKEKEEYKDIYDSIEMDAVSVTTSGTDDFDIPLKGIFGTTILWSSDNEDVMTIENGKAILNRGEENVNVELIANIGNYEKVFSFVVLAKPDDGEPQLVEKTSELSFANKTNRTTFTTSQQVWEQNGIKLINDKAASTSNVADYSSPARFYASSKITIECENITKIVFVCNSSSYATAMKNSIGTVSGATVAIGGSNVTVTFTTPVNNFVIAKLTAQVRVNSLTVTHLVEE